MASETDKLIASISANTAFTAKCPSYDEKAPLDSLPSYPAWLDRQMKLIDTVIKTKDAEVIESFCTVVSLNQGLMKFLEDFGISEKDLVRYAYTEFPEVERDCVCRLYRIWVGDQVELIHNAMEEERIEKTFGKKNRERLKDMVTELHRLAGERLAKGRELRRKKQNLNELKAEIITALKLKGKPETTSAGELQKELRRYIRLWAGESSRLKKESVRPHVPLGFKGGREEYVKQAHEGSEKAERRCRELWALYEDLLAHREEGSETLRKVVDLRKESEGLSRETQKELKEHVSKISKDRKGLERTLTVSRDSAEKEMEELNEELLPLLERIALADKEAQKQEESLSERKYVGQQELDELARKQQELEKLRRRKDEIFLRLGYLQDRVQTLKTTYETEITDEEQFEEEAKHQLQLLKSIPRLEEAMNVFCASYKSSFPLFLYLGNLVKGDGAVLQTGGKLGSGIDLLLKAPLLGMGITDIGKCKAYDTGSMTLSLKLGLSVGVKKKVTVTGGLAVEYNAGLSVEDNRVFKTISEFILVATARVKIPKLFKVAFDYEIGKWRGGFEFQDQYHWAAWLAARWGHFIARANACDIYMGKANVGPDHLPDKKTLAELDALTEQILGDDELIQSVYGEIRQYLDYPVIRTSQKGYFEGGRLKVKCLGVKVETQGNLRKEHDDLFIIENEKGKAVEYKTTFHAVRGALEASVGKHSVQAGYEIIMDHPVLINNGETYTILIGPALPPEVWVRVLDLLLGVLSGEGEIGAKMKRLVSDLAKLGIQSLIEEYAKNYVAEKTKWTEINFYFTQGSTKYQYVRTRMELAKKLEASIPVFKFTYVDFGAKFEYVRTFEESLGSGSMCYYQLVHHGLRGIPAQKQPFGETTTLRPDAMSGGELWKSFVHAHRHDLWHLFREIGTEPKSTVRRELAACRAVSEAADLVQVCEAQEGFAKYQIRGLGLVTSTLQKAKVDELPRVGKFFDKGVTKAVPLGVPVLGTLMRHLKGMEDQEFAKALEGTFNTIMPVFQRLLDTEYDLRKAEEEKLKKSRFQRVAQPTSKVFRARDEQLLRISGFAAQLRKETGKTVKACLKCLEEVGDYDTARYVLSVPLIPTKYWVSEKEVSTCPSCHETIQAGAFSSNKSHCRICGGVFCRECCRDRPVPTKISTSKIKICPTCEQRVSLGMVPLGPLDKTGPPKPKEPIVRTAKPLFSDKTEKPRETESLLLQKTEFQKTGLQKPETEWIVVPPVGEEKELKVPEKPTTKITPSEPKTKVGSLFDIPRKAKAPSPIEKPKEIKAPFPERGPVLGRRFGEADSNRQLDVFLTVGDGSCGIHAMLGEVDQLGQYRYDRPGDVRRDIGREIRETEGYHEKYEHLIAELLQEIAQKRAENRSLRGNEPLLWDQLNQKIQNLQNRIHQVREGVRNEYDRLRRTRETIISQYHFGIIGEDEAYEPLRLFLVDGLLGSNAGSDREARRTLELLHTDEERTQALRGMPRDYTKNLVRESLVGLTELVAILSSMPLTVESYRTYHRELENLGENSFRPLVDESSAQFRNAYAEALQNGGYYLLTEDLEVLADLRSRPLVIYRRDDRNREHFVMAKSYNQEAVGEPYRVFHEGVHWERAVLH